MKKVNNKKNKTLIINNLKKTKNMITICLAYSKRINYF